MSFRRTLRYLTHWESWDYRIKLIPLVPVWLWHGWRGRSWWFFTAANPTLTFGGFQGDSKQDMYAHLPPGTYPRTLLMPAGLPLAEAEARLRAHHFAFPFVVKPEVGMMGLLFRKIDTIEGFRAYHRHVAVGYLVQEWVAYPLEVSVFYYRLPGAATGTITGFVRKEFLDVVGDGRATLGELITRYDRVAYRQAEMRARHADRLHAVIPAGEVVRLNHALNLTRGGRLVSLEHEKDARLLRLFDGLSHHAGQFYYGRYDIKCRSINDLKAGRHYVILEYNGSGAAPHHVYGNGNSLGQAYRIILHHWAALARIARLNHDRGEVRWGFWRGLTFLLRSERYMQRLRRLDRQLAALSEA